MSQVSDGQAEVVQGGVQSRPASGMRLPGLYLAGVVSVLGGLLLWEVVSRFLVANALFLAAPSQIFSAILALAKTGELWRHMSISAIEFALGYAIASVLGVMIGFAMAESATMKRALQPWVSGLYATPTIALAAVAELACFIRSRRLAGGNIRPCGGTVREGHRHAQRGLAPAVQNLQGVDLSDGAPRGAGAVGSVVHERSSFEWAAGGRFVYVALRRWRG